MHPHKPHYDRHAGSTENVAFMKRISKQRIDPPAVVPGMDAADLIDAAFLSYNGGRLREGCQLYAQRMLAPDCTVGLALSGALTPAGLGISCLVPLIEAGFIDWIISTGANLYHDTHYALGMDLYQAGPNLPDLELRENQVIRIYDIIFDYQNLLGTDKFYRTLCRGEAFQGTFGTAEFHGLVGKYLAEREVLKLAQAGLPVVIVNLSAPVGERDIKPTPTFKFRFVASSESSSIRRLVGPSDVSGFSMNTLSPFSMAYLK